MKKSVTELFSEFKKIKYKYEEKEIFILDVMGKIKPIELSKKFGIKIRNLSRQEIKNFILYKIKVQQ